MGVSPSGKVRGGGDSCDRKNETTKQVKRNNEEECIENREEGIATEPKNIYIGHDDDAPIRLSST